jgi:agmatine deiminase
MRRLTAWMVVCWMAGMVSVVPATTAWAAGGEGAAPVADRASAPQQVAEDPSSSLPAYLTAEEALLPQPTVTQEMRLLLEPPTGPLVCPAEYEPCEGIYVAWESFTSVLIDMIVPMTNNTPPGTAFVVCDSASEVNSARTTLTSAGADLDYVEFIVRTTDTVWIRDYGPRFVWDEGTRALVDHTYNRPRANDNALNDYLTSQSPEPQYDIPLVHGGGNFHLFSNGDAFMSDLILEENPGLTAQDVIQYYADYQGLSLTIYEGLPQYFDSTRHIDMWMLPVGDMKVIVGDYSTTGGEIDRRIEDAVDDLVLRGYTVYRTPGWSSGGTHYTYTNAVICNDQVFLPYFGSGYASRDAEALSVFQTAMPDHEIIQVYCGSIIRSAGAVHCIVMHKPSYELAAPSVKLLSPHRGALEGGQPAEILWAANDDVAVTAVDIYLSRDGGSTYPELIASDEPHDGTFTWMLPDEAAFDCKIRVVAFDGDGNSDIDESDDTFAIVRDESETIYSFPMDDNPGWTGEGDWAFGQPTGGGGDHGYPDPTSGFNGPNVFGYNLNGDYGDDEPERDLTTGALDCSNLVNTTLSFQRWLGVESPTYDHAYVRVSSNGSTWLTIWENTGEVADNSWVPQELDISSYADGEETVYLKWVMGPTDESWQYCGWNLDEVEISAIDLGGGPGAIVASTPPDGAIDARKPHEPDDPLTVYGWQEIELQFESDVAGVEAGDFTVTELGGDGFAPAMVSVSPTGPTSVLVTLDEPLEPLAWTTITHTPSGSGITLGYLPADTNQDGYADSFEVLSLIDHLNGVEVLPEPYATDINRSGLTESFDVLEVINLLNGAQEYDEYNGASLP